MEVKFLLDGADLLVYQFVYPDTIIVFSDHNCKRFDPSMLEKLIVVKD